MQLPELQRCCCGCCSVQTGTNIIGVLSAILSIISIISYVKDLASPFVTSEDLELQEFFALYQTVFLMVLLISIFELVISILLLIGVQKRIAGFFDIWLFVSSYHLASSVIPAITITIFLFFMSYVGSAFLFLILYLVAASFGVYLLVVVHSCKLWVINEEMGSQEV